MICRAYPFSKGRYRLMKLCETFLEPREEIVSDLHGRYKFALNLGERNLQSSFYYFIPEYYESWTQRCITESVSAGMIAVDIGAHMGLLTLLLAKQVGANGRVYSFEPEEKNFKRLKANIELNRLSSVQLFRAAVSDKTGKSYLRLNLSDAGHSLVEASKTDSNNTSASLQEIDTVSFDDFLEDQKISRVNLLKIDAEKSEALVLEGAKNALSRGLVDCLICEVHSSDKEASKGDFIRKFLSLYGYRCYVLNPMLAGQKYLSEYPPDKPVRGLQNFLFKK